MKKLLLCAMLLICSMFQLSVFAQNYHEDDKEGLRQFLRQQSSGSVYDRYNFEAAGLSASDTLRWYESEDWLQELAGPPHNRIDIYYDDALPRRIISLRVTSRFSGKLDCRRFNNLKELELLGASYLPSTVEVDLSQNLSLEDLRFYFAHLVKLDLPSNPNLTKLHLAGSSLKELDLSGCVNLKELRLENNDCLENLNVSNNIRVCLNFIQQ
ncbi:hypothetical protein CLV62_13834 [Dysgonomonas alginatilytica]|uniref:Leucine rich repeat (LRR) protein n=1 Tax=Dysgonomonas alginatilytica TaxID=1605892 RepID=A0A2V3PL35_9BACT|nr:leucine-rich repeat domain-containing protein [Dysgonomonas alginatilytica]PXV59329.1 hypothetical protein CLV62_13834 [Dysgonomonas alginatilytica]